MPFIYRVEHDRDRCTSRHFRAGGESLSGHGPHVTDNCWTNGIRPNFGATGEVPKTLPTYYQRCAVTAAQWQEWVTPEHYCQFLADNCLGEEYCPNCPPNNDYRPASGWVIVAYWVEDSDFGIRWRFDNNQVIFDPAYSVNMGIISYDDLCAMIKDETSTGLTH